MAVPTYDEKRRLFEHHFLFGQLSGGEIDALLTYARAAHYPAGREIYPKGSSGQSVLAVVRGTVKISSPSPAGKEIVLNLINAGEIFGEIALIDGGPRSADATALTDCDLLVLERRDVMPILERHAEICMTLLRVLCQRLRHTSEQVEDVLFRHLESRIAKALLQLTAGGGEPRGLSPDLRLSQRELGNLVGGSRESVNKHLQAWHRAGLIRLARGSIVIRDPAAIERLI
jgi:CRP/FNR family cyclic AMP-dependent transcriptional regulator